MKSAALPQPLKIVLALPPNRGNQRVHWRTEHKQKSAYYAAARVRILQQVRARQRCATVADYFTVFATLYVWSPMDDDNAVSRLKFVLDILRIMGVLHSDKRPWCALSGIPLQIIDRKSPRVELLLESVSGEPLGTEGAQ